MNENDDDFEFQRKMEAEDRRISKEDWGEEDEYVDDVAQEELEAEWRAQGREDNEPCDDDFQQEFDDWSVRGAEEDLQRMEAAFAEDSAQEEQEAAETEAEVREYRARQKQKDELVKELAELRKTYDHLRKQIEEKEGLLLHLYGWDWEEMDLGYCYEHPGYPEGATEEQMQAQDMASELGYDPVTIEGYTPTPKVVEPKMHEIQPPENWRTRVIREAKEATAAFIKEREDWQMRHGYFKKHPTSGANTDADSIPF